MCGKKQHTKAEIRSEMSELICGRIAAGENYNLTRDSKLSGIGLIVIGIGVLLAGIICSATSSMWGGISIAIGFLFGLVMLIYAGIKYNR